MKNFNFTEIVFGRENSKLLSELFSAKFEIQMHKPKLWRIISIIILILGLVDCIIRLYSLEYNPRLSDFIYYHDWIGSVEKIACFVAVFSLFQFLFAINRNKEIRNDINIITKANISIFKNNLENWKNNALSELNSSVLPSGVSKTNSERLKVEKLYNYYLKKLKELRKFQKFLLGDNE